MTRARSPLSVSTSSMSGYCVLRVSGVLDGSTYLELRNAIVKAALDEPRAVVVDATALSVASASAWNVFTSARWHVSVWPDIPVAVACEDVRSHEQACATGITRYVPVFPTVDQAVAGLPDGSRRCRHRASAELPAVPGSVAAARGLVSDWLTAWSLRTYIASVSVATTVLMENVASHTDGVSVLRLESTEDTVTVAVMDHSGLPVVRHETDRRYLVTGVDYLTAMSRSWGQNPTPDGKAVWAVIGPENLL